MGVAQLRLQAQLRHQDTEMIRRQGQSLPSQTPLTHPDLVALALDLESLDQILSAAWCDLNEAVKVGVS